MAEWTPCARLPLSPRRIIQLLRQLGQTLTSITETATFTLELTALLAWSDRVVPRPETIESPILLPGTHWELLQLDRPGWAQALADNKVNQDFTRRLDRLVAAWLTQDDYRHLREIAFKKSEMAVAEAAEATFSDWIEGTACKRLSHLVLGMRFTEPKVPICYALCSAQRAVHSAIAYSRKPQGLSEQEIAAAKLELEESAEEYTALALLGILDEPAEEAK